MRFWLDVGCDGFWVDMAMSLVKGDDGEKTDTSMLWHNIRAMLDKEYPSAAMVSEWSYPKQAIATGFHMDFFLNFDGNAGGFKSLFRDYDLALDNTISGVDKSFFKKGAQRNIRVFIDEYLYHYEATKHAGYLSLVTGNHDVVRMRCNLDPQELGIAYAFIFTMPGVPFLYYGDEIGMRYLNLPTKEGGYFRTGSRTPMQWTVGKNRLCFGSIDFENIIAELEFQEKLREKEENSRCYVLYKTSDAYWEEDNKLKIVFCASETYGWNEDDANCIVDWNNFDSEIMESYTRKGAAKFVYCLRKRLEGVSQSDIGKIYALLNNNNPIAIKALDEVM